MFFFYFVANKLSLLGDQLDGFTYLVACHYCYITMILYVFFYFVANKLSLSLSLSLSLGCFLKHRASDSAAVKKSIDDGGD